MIHKIQYITHNINGYSHEQQVEDVCKAGIKWIQLRMKNSSDEEIIYTGKKVREICNHYSTVFILNDKVNLVNVVSADGVHLGKEDSSTPDAKKIIGENKIIGRTANTLEDIISISKHNVHYVGLGPFKFTSTKEKLSPTLGLMGYQNILKELDKLNILIPVYAIGGIEKKDIKELFDTNITGIAVSSLIHKALNKEEIIKYISEIKQHEKPCNSQQNI